MSAIGQKQPLNDSKASENTLWLTIDDGAFSIDKYTLKLSAWLKTEAAKSRKQRRTLKQLHLELRALGYGGVVRSGHGLRQALEGGSIGEGQFGEQINILGVIARSLGSNFIHPGVFLLSEISLFLHSHSFQEFPDPIYALVGELPDTRKYA